jgi:hypothetical protein
MPAAEIYRQQATLLVPRSTPKTGTLGAGGLYGYGFDVSIDDQESRS